MIQKKRLDSQCFKQDQKKRNLLVFDICSFFVNKNIQNVDEKPHRFARTRTYFDRGGFCFARRKHKKKISSHKKHETRMRKRFVKRRRTTIKKKSLDLSLTLTLLQLKFCLWTISVTSHCLSAVCSWTYILEEWEREREKASRRRIYKEMKRKKMKEKRKSLRGNELQRMREVRDS